jgi:hypothetical protein
MSAEFFDQMPVEAGLKFSPECFEVLACSVNTQAVIVEGKGKDEDFVGSDARRIGTCLAYVVYAHGGAGCEPHGQPGQNEPGCSPE